MTRVLWLSLLLGCGATSSQGSGSAADESEAEVEVVDRAGEGDEAASECTGRQGAECAGADGCVRLPNGACRAATHECELIELDLRGVSPAFDGGDPCQRANGACAWSTSTGRCAPFEAVPACPATAEEAAALRVFCDHRDQPALACNYPGTQCACRRTPYCGGAAPPPERQYPPAHFSCVPDFDDRGCPTRPVDPGTRCDVDSSVQCHVGCYSVYTCERGQWRHDQLPPRP